MKTTAKLFLLTLLAGLLVLPAAYAKQGPDDSALGMGNDVPVGIAVGPPETIFVFETGFFNLQSQGLHANAPGVPQVGASVAAPTFVLVQQTPWKLLGGQYQTVLIAPTVYQQLNVDGHSLSPASAYGITNFGWDNMLGWKKGNFFFKGGLETWAPTATKFGTEYRNPAINPLGASGGVGNSISGHYWEFDPTFAITYIKPKSWEFGDQTQLWFDTTDTSTQYHSGNAIASTWTLLKTVKNAGIGVNGFFAQAFTNDTCLLLGGACQFAGTAGAVRGTAPAGAAVPGAGVGDKEGYITIGPHFQLVTKSGIFNIKYFHNVYTRNTLGGDQFELEWVMPISKWLTSKKS